MEWNLASVASAAVALLSATTLSAPVAGQGAPTSAERNHNLRYSLVDLGTFGGPNSAETQEFPFINNHGTVVGFSDTAIPDANPEGFAFHAFRWQGGVMKDLGTLPGGVNSIANVISDSGVAVGESENGIIDPLLGTRENAAVLWRTAGRIVRLGTLGGNESLATAVNDRGQVGGLAANAVPDPFSLFGWGTQTRAFVWEKGVMRDLGTLGGPDAGAFYINKRGQLAGASYTNSTPNPVTGQPTLDPFLWQNGTMTDVGSLGGTLGFTNALNNKGQVVGQSNLFGDQTAHPFLWDRGTLKDLGTLGGDFGTASWLNDTGDVAGGARTADASFHAFFWRKGVMTDLGTVNGDTCSAAHNMNADGTVVGTSGDCGGQFEKHGFVSVRGGQMIDLNEFVPPGSTLTVTDGETINNRGEIAGSGMLPNGDFHTVVLIPCDHQHGTSDAKGCQT